METVTGFFFFPNLRPSTLLMIFLENNDTMIYYQQSLEKEKAMAPHSSTLPGKSHGWRSLVGCSPWGLESQTRLSNFSFTLYFHALEKEMATHSSVLAWRIPGTGEPGGCCLWGHTESDMTEVTQQQQQQQNQCIYLEENIKMTLGMNYFWFLLK